MSIVSGAKIHVGGSKVRCIEDSGNSYTLEEGVSQVPDTIGPFYQHVLLVRLHTSRLLYTYIVILTSGLKTKV